VRWVYNATIAVMAPSAGLPVTGFKLYRSAGGLATALDVLVCDGSDPSAADFVVTGLTPSETYRFGATAVNAVGESSKAQYITVTCCVAPGRMARPSVGPSTGADSAVELHWTAPDSTGGMALMEYRVYRDDGNLGEITTSVYSGGTDLTTVVSSGLTVGKHYRFVVEAVNGVGAGVSSAVLNYQVCGPPSPPDSVTASERTDTTAKVSWTPSGSTGGSGCLLDRYEVSLREGSGGPFTVVKTVGPSVISYVHTGLGPGHSYTFKVVAYNGAYASFAPEANVTFTAGSPPSAIPTAPTFISGQVTPSLSLSVAHGTAESSSLPLDWLAP
ncbi:hypothetical protein FOZ62_009197, partial [Perkinsus olseni]